MSDRRVIGTSSMRVDAVEKVTGAAMYSGDYKPDRMVYGKILGSPHAHARIISIDTTKAEQLPGVVGIITGKDVPDTRTGGYIRDRHIICREYVRYVGDYVALVAATSESIAEEAAKLIKVEYQQLPAALTIDEAYKQNADVVVHANMNDYVPTGFQGVDEFGWDDTLPNQFVSYTVKNGDISKGFEQADIVIENTFNLPIVSHCTLETHQCIVIPKPDGGITAYASEQAGTTAKYDIASALGLETSKVHLHIPYLGGGFGGKTGVSTVYPAAIAAMKIQRPVCIIQSREESFTSGGVRSSASLTIKDGFKNDGTLIARHIKMVANGGAYSSHALIMILFVSEGALGNYRTPNLLIECAGVYTNTPPAAPYRALGSEFMVFAIERNMDAAANKLGIDRGELRMMNLLEDGDIDGSGKEANNNGSKAVLQRTLDRINLREKQQANGPWIYGKSVAIGNKFVGVEDPLGTAAICKILDDGSVEIYTSHVELGQGGLTVGAMVAAEILKMPLDKVRVVFGDSDSCPYDQGTFCSRGTFVHGNAMIEACTDARNKILELASDKMNLVEAALDTEDGIVFQKGKRENYMNVTDLFDGCGSNNTTGIIGMATYHHPDAHNAMGSKAPVTYSIGAWGVEVAVNKETGEVRLEKLEGCYDAGHVINQMACEGQIEGAFSMGLGQAIYEECLLNSDGKMINANFRDYKIPTFMDGPRNGALNFSFIENPHRYGPYGAKGIGEVAMIPVMPAVANAISDAVGVDLYELPMNRARVLQAIKDIE